MKLLIFLSMTLIIALAQDNIPNDPQKSSNCPDPRPVFCPKIYMPVVSTEGPSRGTIYGNACDACSNFEVTHYEPVNACDMTQLVPPKQSKEDEKLAASRLKDIKLEFCGVTEKGEFIDIQDVRASCEKKEINMFFMKKCPN